MKPRYPRDPEIDRYVDTHLSYGSFEEAFDGYEDDFFQIASKDVRGSWNLFELARLTLTLERNIGRKLGIDELERIFDRSYETANSYSCINRDIEPEELFEEFIGVYRSTKVALDESLMDGMYRRAENESPPPGMHLLPKKNKQTIFLASLCYQLHLHHKGPFFLSVRSAQDFLCTLSVQTINNKMRYLLMCGIIREVEKGTLKGRIASSYEYIAHLAPDPDERDEDSG
tara:strand:- start:120 stop:806 length:687 start_codon:yes stop_codon:yes gene_type:complete